MSDDARVLILGFGNPGRRDDGLGPAFAARLAALGLPGVRVESAYQLNVEDAAAVAQHDIVVFVDASMRADPPFTVRPLLPRQGPPEFTTHSLEPEQVLGLAAGLFGAAGAGYALEIRGYDFDGFGERLSPLASAHLDEALAFLAGALRPGGRLQPDDQPVR